MPRSVAKAKSMSYSLIEEHNRASLTIPTSKVIFEISQENASSTPLWQEGEAAEGRKCQFSPRFGKKRRPTALTITGSNWHLLRCSRKQAPVGRLRLTRRLPPRRRWPRRALARRPDQPPPPSRAPPARCHSGAEARGRPRRAPPQRRPRQRRTSALPSTACLSFTRTLIRVCGIFSMTWMASATGLPERMTAAKNWQAVMRPSPVEL